MSQRYDTIHLNTYRNHVVLIGNMRLKPALIPTINGKSLSAALYKQMVYCKLLVYIFSGAVTPNRPRPLAMTCLVASASLRRTAITASSSPLMRQAL